MAKENKKQKDTDGSPSYAAKDIYVLEGLEPVRRRPGMYIGSTGPDGLHHLIWECVDNALDEAMAGFAKNIEVKLLSGNRISVSDDGRGIPVDLHPQTKKSALETVMTTLHAGGKFGGDSYKVAGGLHGVGVSVVCALSKWMRAEVCRDGAIWTQEYALGKPTAKVKKEGKCDRTGTKVIFEPDITIFQDIKFDLRRIIEHLRQQAYLTPGVRINIIDEREKEKLPAVYSFYFEGGLVSFIRYLTRNLKSIQENIFYVSKEQEEMLVEISLRYTDELQASELSFANNIHTGEGGMHLTGFRTALTRALNDYARQEKLLKEEEENFTGDDVREGLVSIVSVKIKSPRSPQFEGQTKAKLGNPEARTAVDAVMGPAFKEFLEKNREDARAIIDKINLAAKARRAAKAAKDAVLRKGVFEGGSLPGKLADCQSRKPEESELFIVEGDSAGGSAKMGRDRKFQAILPLKGKILNVEKSRLDKMLANQEIRSLIIALGTAIGADFNVDKLRYHRIILMSDADVDGAHIRTLLLTLFYRYFRPVIDGGYLYIAQPPLYKIQKGREARYVYSDSEKERVIAEMAGSKAKEAGKGKKTRKLKLKEVGEDEAVSEAAAEAAEGETAGSEGISAGSMQGATEVRGVRVQRYKGLGEMNPGQLWDTTMNPENRILKQVNIEDAEEADRLFDILMGDVVEPRKKFIQTHAAKVQNLDTIG